MPTYSFNPNQGEVSNLSAQDRLRQANADRMIQMTLANMQDARSAAQMNAAERLGYAQIAGNKDLATISGDYGLRGQELANQAQFGIEGLRGQNAANLAGIAGKNAADVARINVGPEQSRADLETRRYRDMYNDKQNSLDSVINSMLVDKLKSSNSQQNAVIPNLTSIPQWQGQGPAMNLVAPGEGVSPKQGIDWNSLLPKIIKAKMGIQPTAMESAKEGAEVKNFIEASDPDNMMKKKIERYTGAKAFANEDIENIVNNFNNQGYLSSDDVEAFKQYKNNLVDKLKNNGYSDDIVNQILSDVKSRIDSTLQNNWFSSGPQGKQISALFSIGNTGTVQPSSFQTQLPSNQTSIQQPQVRQSVQEEYQEPIQSVQEEAQEVPSSNSKNLTNMPKDILYGLAKMIEDLSNGPYKYKYRQ